MFFAHARDLASASPQYLARIYVLRLRRSLPILLPALDVYDFPIFSRPRSEPGNLWRYLSPLKAVVYKRESQSLRRRECKTLSGLSEF